MSAKELHFNLKISFHIIHDIIVFTKELFWICESTSVFSVQPETPMTFFWLSCKD